MSQAQNRSPPRRKRPVLSNQSVRIMSAQLRELGIRPEPVLRESGIDLHILNDPKGQVGPEQEYALQKRFAELTRRFPGVWVRTGLQYRCLSLGAFGLALISAPTMRRALELGVAYQDLTFSQCTYRLHHGDGAAVDGLELVTDQVEPALLEFSIHRSLGAVHTVFNDMWQGRFPFTRVETTLSRPPEGDIGHLLGVPVVFGASRNVMYFPGDVLERPLPLGNPLLEDTYERQCREILERHDPAPGLTDRVYALLVRSTGRWPSAREIAGRLAMSERTLQRRLLGDAGIHFRDLLDNVREQRARDLLCDTHMSVEQIAECLGYTEGASFTRAFVRWTGQPPTAFRRAGRVHAR